MWVHMPKIFKWFNVNLYIYNNLNDNYEKKKMLQWLLWVWFHNKITMY